MIRKIHLDFHTHPDTRHIGRDFDPDAFAETLASAGVNYLATPGKCHFGNIYFASDVGHTHPHLNDPEMFPRTVSACVDRGIDVQAYWTLGLDAYAAEEHPAWRQLYEDGTAANWGHYLHMCFASPYIEEMLIPEVQECIDRCPGLSGFWFDISLYVDGAFYSRYFDRLARERLGERADDENARWHLARRIVRERCIQIDEAIRAMMPDAENYYNSLVGPGEAENIPLQPLHEVENPILFQTAEKMTTNLRWLRAHDAKTIGLASRFQGAWSDPGTVRTADQIRFDVARTVALGAHVSMGDHRYPDGHLEPEVYRRLAPAYKDVESLGKWIDNAQPCREAVLLASVRRGSGDGLLRPVLSPTTRQAARTLEENGLQFDVLTVEDPLPDDPGLVLWMGEEAGSHHLMKRLEEHVANGGQLLAFNAAIDSPGAEELFGVRQRPWTPSERDDSAIGDMSDIGHVSPSGAEGDAIGPSEQFVHLREEVGGEPFRYVLSGPVRLIEAASGSEILGDRYEPISSKPPFPAERPSGPMIVQNGDCVYCAADLFGEIAEVGNAAPQRMIAALCERLLPSRLVRHDGGSTVAAHLHRTPDGYALHLVHWAIDRWDTKVNTAAQFPTLGPIKVTLALEAPTARVTLEPAGTELDFTTEDERCMFTVPSMRIGQVIGIRTA